MKRYIKSVSAALIAVIVAAMSAACISAATITQADAVLNFTDTGVSLISGGTDGYKTEGTTLTITEAGTYLVTGSCRSGSIVIKKGVTGVKLVLQDLTLSCDSTAPLLLKKGASADVIISGRVVLTDLEDPSKDGTDDNFEGTAVKVNGEGAVLTVYGNGTLVADGSRCKNGIKAGEGSKIVINGAKISVSAANNGIASDGSIEINGGNIGITCENDGLKSEPDETASEGKITINAGQITIDAGGDGIQARSSVVINGGTLKITAGSDGIQSYENITITAGTFDITCGGGSGSTSFNDDTLSAKGIKVSPETDEEDFDGLISISGGTFSVDSADDAIHSDGNVTITGGVFAISTGDDGVHANNELRLGTENGYERDPDFEIKKSYEGLEAANMYIYSGRYRIQASDDGINAAGGSSNGSDFGFGWGNDFGRGGGGRPGGGPGGGFPGGGPGGFGEAGDYNIYVYGGEVYIDCTGDGIDSNGAIYLYGGTLTVLSMQANGDNSPLDCESELVIEGATVFGAGSSGMMRSGPSGQAYLQSSSRVAAGTVINVTSGNTVVYSEKLVRNVSFIIFSSPTVSGNSLTTAGSVDNCVSDSWKHRWDAGTSASGVITYTCESCGATERQSYASGAREAENITAEIEVTAQNTDGPSSWAKDEVEAAIAEDLVPESLQKDYTSPITRGEVAEMFISLLEKASGKTVEEIMAEKGVTVNENAFSDTDDRAVLCANALGIINGMGDGRFAPDSTLKRAQIAAIINRVARVMGVETSGYTHDFTDIIGNYSWADSELGWPVHAGIINGVGQGRFSPGGDLTTEQAILITYRALNALK